MDEALEGMTSLVLAGIRQRDGIERWYRVAKIPLEEEEEQDGTVDGSE